MFNTLVQEHADNDRLRKRDHPMLARNLDNEIDQAEVDALLAACDEGMPLVARYYALKRRLLGYERLYDYDRYAPVFPDLPACSFAEARAIVPDADRASAAGAQASIQINTGGECHLDAVMLRGALEQLDLPQFDLLIGENVGNLVCPADFRLGTHRSILIASVPEGDDKPYKYPGMYRGVDALVINKVDLLPYIPFKMDYFKKGVEALNPGVITFPISCRTSEGLDAWTDWLIAQARKPEKG